MAKQKFTNSALSRLTGALTNVATSLSVTGGDGALFPSLAAGEYFMATLQKVVGTSTVKEIVKVTARATDTFTIVRGQEGSTATTFAIGDLVELRITAGSMDNAAQLIADNAFTGANSFTGGSVAVPTVAKLDNDTSAASTAYVKADGFTFGDESTASGTATLTNVVAGNVVIGTSASAHTQTLPLANSVRKADIIAFFNSGAGAMTVQRQGSDTLDGVSGGILVVLKQFESAVFDSNNVGTWRLIGGSANVRAAMSSTLSKVIMDTPTAQSIPNNASTQITNWTSRLNTGNNMNTVTGVFTAERPGQYLVCAEITLASAAFAAGSECTVVLHKNGSQIYSARFVAVAAQTFAASSPHMSIMVNLVAGDTLDIRCFQNSGGAINTASSANTFLTITELM